MNAPDSARWKQSRLLILHLVNIAIFALAIPASIYLLSHIQNTWTQFKNPDNWDTRTARVLSAYSLKEGGKSSRYFVIVKMQVVGGPSVEDTFAPVAASEAEIHVSELKRRKTVSIYQNKLNPTEYVLSPVWTGQTRFLPTLLLTSAGTFFGLISLGMLWKYMRDRIDFAAITRDRLQAKPAR